MKPAFPAEVRSTIAELRARGGITYATLGRVIGKSASYVSRFVRNGVPAQLAEKDARLLAQFFGIDPRALGAIDVE